MKGLLAVTGEPSLSLGFKGAANKSEDALGIIAGFSGFAEADWPH